MEAHLQPFLDWVLRSFSSLGECVVLADASLPDLPLVYVSPRFADATGYDPEECVGRNCRFLQGPGTDPQAIARIRAAIARAAPHTEEILNYRRDATPFWNRLHLAPLHDSEGAVRYYVGVQHDVSEFRRLESQIAIDTQRTLLSSPREPVKDMSFSIAHEVNTPLTVIDGRVHMASLLLGGSAPDITGALAAIVEARAGIYKLARMAASLRVFAHSSENSDLGPVDVGQTIRQAAERAGLAASHVETGDGLVTLGDPLVLGRLFQALIENRSARSGEQAVAVVRVSDAPFHCLRVSVATHLRREDPSFALMDAVVRRHGGSLSVEPDTERGSSALEDTWVIVTLPRLLLEP